MSDPLTTNHLKLPYLAAAQAQKHVTHNEALTLLDTAVQLAVLDATLTAPPDSPADGDRHIVAASATGAWAGKDGQVATWVDGAWAYAAPEAGWLAFDVGTSTLLAFVSGAWQAATAGASEVDKFGVNTTADDTNRLSVRSAAALFSGIAAADGGTGDMRFIIDKEADGDTASLLFQSGWSGRAEIGLAGDTDLVLKVSADGSTWTEAIRVDKTSGQATILYDNATSGLSATNVQAAIDEIAASGGGGGGGAVASVFGRTGAVVAAAGDYDACQVDNDSGVSGATVKDALDTLDSLASGKQAANGDLAAIAGLSPSNDDVLQRKAGAWTNRSPAQLKADLAITAADIVSAVSNTEFGYLDGVTSAIQTQLNAKATLASPTFTGTPAAPTAAVDTSTTQVATTAFVLGQASASGDGTPAMDGTAARGTSAHFARADHVHPTDTSLAPKASPTFTGTPAAPTASSGANTTQIATTAFVTAAVAALSTVYQGIATILTAIAGLATTGLIARTGSGTVATRTITGTTNHIAVTNGDGVSGNPTLDVGSSVALLDTAAQSLSGGARVVTYDNGTKSSGTFTPDPGNGPNQKVNNNGAHTLAPGTNYGAYYLDVTNGASAGAITTSGWTVVDGASFDTTSGHKFKCICTISEIGSTLSVKAMQ
jgi:hypothetical protein